METIEIFTPTQFQRHCEQAGYLYYEFDMRNQPTHDFFRGYFVYLRFDSFIISLAPATIVFCDKNDTRRPKNVINFSPVLKIVKHQPGKEVHFEIITGAKGNDTNAKRHIIIARP